MCRPYRILCICFQTLKLWWFGIGDDVFENRQPKSFLHYIAQTRNFSTNFKDKLSYSKLSLESQNLLKKISKYLCLFLSLYFLGVDDYLPILYIPNNVLSYLNFACCNGCEEKKITNLGMIQYYVILLDVCIFE